MLVRLQCNMDDSRAALAEAYNAVCERYNKLRWNYRHLLKDKTCPQCRQKLNASVETADSPDRQTTSAIGQRSSADANEIREICDELKQLVEARQVVNGSWTIHGIIPRLQNVASRVARNAAFDVQQESLLDSSASEMSSSLAHLSDHQSEASAVDLLHSQQLRIFSAATETSEDLAASKTSEMSEDTDQQDKNFITGKSHK